eukprot:tig00001214_g7554.t1
MRPERGFPLTQPPRIQAKPFQPRGSPLPPPEPLSPEQLDSLCRQVAYYFSDANLTCDQFMQKQLARNPDGYVPLSVLMTFNRVKAMIPSLDMTILRDALLHSTALVMNEEGTAVRRLRPWQGKDHIQRTIYVENLPLGTTNDALVNAFSRWGPVESVNMNVKGQFCFVMYDEEASAAACLDGWAAAPAIDAVSILSKAEWYKRKKERQARGERSASRAAAAPGTPPPRARGPPRGAPRRPRRTPPTPPPRGREGDAGEPGEDKPRRKKVSVNATRPSGEKASSHPGGVKMPNGPDGSKGFAFPRPAALRALGLQGPADAPAPEAPAQ